MTDITSFTDDAKNKVFIIKKFQFVLIRVGNESTRARKYLIDHKSLQHVYEVRLPLFV